MTLRQSRQEAQAGPQGDKIIMVTRPRRTTRDATVTRGARPSKWILRYLLTGKRPDKDDTAALAEEKYLLLAGCNSIGLPVKTNMYNPDGAWFHIEHPEVVRELPSRPRSCVEPGRLRSPPVPLKNLR